MLTLNGLTTGYRRHTVSQPLHATLGKGCLTALLGPNGCGKSTLLRTLAGIQRPLSGQALINGEDTTAMTPSQLATRVSIVLTGRPDTPTLSVRETVEMGRAPYTSYWGGCTPDDRRIAAKAMSLVGVTPLADRPLHTLSDGECQKVMIAKALAQQTPIILLDEPTAFIDYPGKIDLFRLLSRLAQQGKSILISTHDLELALRHSHTIWLLDRSLGLTTTTPDDPQKALLRYFPTLNTPQ